MENTRFSGKELASLLLVSPAALSKAVKNKYFCAKMPVYDWAVYAESGRVSFYELGGLTTEILCHLYVMNCRKRLDSGALSTPVNDLPPRLRALVDKVMQPTPEVKLTISPKKAISRPPLPVPKRIFRPDPPFPGQGHWKDKLLWGTVIVIKSWVESRKEGGSAHG